MANLNERICAYCNKSFDLTYTSKRGYSYALDTKCCSKSCATSLIHGVEPDALKEEALRHIRAAGKYCTKEEICNGTGHSSKTFYKHGITFHALNNELGYVKPKSKFEEKVGDFLKEDFSIVEAEKSFDGLVGSTGYSLRVDFYLPEINTVVEADGSQHRDQKHPWHTWNNGTVADYDEIKNAFFKANGIAVVRVPYKRNLKKEDVSSRLS